MKILIKHTNLDATPAIDEFVQEKINSLSKLLTRWERGPDSVVARVEVSRTTQHHHKGNVFRAEVTIDLPGRILRAEHTGDDVRVAIDLVKDKLHREITKYNDQKTH